MNLDPLVISDDHLVRVCRYRQSGCCKYIVMFEQQGSFYCVKNVPELKNKIEQNSHEMVAQGDNCEGLKYEAGA